MATGFQHAKATRRNLIIISTVSAGATVIYGPLPLLLIPGAWFGHLLTPDLDLSEAHPIYLQRKLIQKYRALGWVLWAFWFPYAKLCHHRGMSHSWPLGTVIRIIYTLWLPTALAMYYFPTWFTPDVLPAWYLILAAIFLTWSIQDSTHLFMDSKFYKKHFLKPTSQKRR